MKTFAEGCFILLGAAWALCMIAIIWASLFLVVWSFL